jgi:anti-anti-sigma factor
VQFAVERTTAHGQPVVSVRGELDLSTAPALAEVVEAELAAGSPALAVDLSGTTFLDSSGARALALLARAAQRAGSALTLVIPPSNRPVRLVTDLIDLQSVVPIVDSRAEAAVAEGQTGP